MTPTTTPRTGSLLALALTGALLSGCSGPADSEATPAPAASLAATSTSAPEPSAEPATATATATATDDAPGATAGDFPTCDEVKAVLGPVVEGLVELDESENGVATGSDGAALGCSWYTPETDGSSTALDRYGFISLGASHDPEYTAESMEPLGWVVDDPAVSAAGAWALKVGGGYDPAAQLDATGVQVVRDGVVVVLTSGGVALQDVPQLAALTEEWALGAGLAVLDLMG